MFYTCIGCVVHVYIHVLYIQVCMSVYNYICIIMQQKLFCSTLTCSGHVEELQNAISACFVALSPVTFYHQKALASIRVLCNC